MPEVLNHILIVDDEAAIQSLIKRYFQKNGATVYCAGSGEEMHGLLKLHDIDMVFLDVNLPDKNDFTLLDEIKQNYDAGVIMLTSQNELSDRLTGLNGGADDFVPKPFEMSELLARSNAVLRRLGRLKTAPEPDTGRYLFQGYCLDNKVRELLSPEQALVDITPAELDLLLVFLKHPETVLSRDYLLQQTRGRDAGPYDRTIDVRVGQLRKKISIPETEPPLFKTIRGGGYILQSSVTRTEPDKQI